MNKQELVKELSQTLEIPQKDVRVILDAYLEEILLILEEGQQYKQTGFGTFRTVLSSERISYNPALKKKMRLPVRKKIKFKPSSKLKERINE